jgi:hypothetical protein
LKIENLQTYKPTMRFYVSSCFCLSVITELANYYGESVSITSLYISTIAGTGSPTSSGDSGQATSATFNSPSGIWGDLNNNLYISDKDNNSIRKVNVASGIITTICSGLSSPSGVFVTTDGLVYFTDSLNHRVKRMALDTTVSTYAGTGIQGSVGDMIRATSAKLNTPYGLWMNTQGDESFVTSGI